MPGTHRGSSRASFVLVAGAAMVVVALGVLLFFYFRDQAVIISPFAPQEPEVPEFSFVVDRAASIPVSRQPRKKARREAVQQIHGVMDRFYIAAFLDPAEWEGGSFRTALGEFTTRAAREARRDLGHLTLGNTAEQVEMVIPEKGTLRVSLLYNRFRKPVAAVAAARFIATGQHSDGTEALSIEHRGDYILKLVRGRWAIVGYEVRGNIQETPAASEGGTPSPGGTAAPATEGGTP